MTSFLLYTLLPKMKSCNKPVFGCQCGLIMRIIRSSAGSGESNKRQEGPFVCSLSAVAPCLLVGKACSKSGLHSGLMCRELLDWPD